MSDFLKTYKAVVTFNDVGGPSQFLERMGKYLLLDAFSVSSREPNNTMSITLSGAQPRLEVIGRSLNDKPEFEDFFVHLKEQCEKGDNHVCNQLCIDSVEITTPSKGREVA